MSIIELKNVNKEYSLGKVKLEALKNINLKIKEGDFVTIIGTSGSGKTTLLNIIGLIDSLTSGEILIDGANIGGMKDVDLTHLRLNKLGFIFQTFNLIEVLNVQENVEFPLLLKKELSKREIAEKSQNLLKSVGLNQHSLHRPAELSGGQRQRVAIARALITNPKIVLADEPTANLDSKTSVEILELMKKLNRDYKTTFIFATHDPEVLNYSKTKIEIKDGAIVKTAKKATKTATKKATKTATKSTKSSTKKK